MKKHKQSPPEDVVAEEFSDLDNDNDEVADVVVAAAGAPAG